MKGVKYGDLFEWRPTIKCKDVNSFKKNRLFWLENFVTDVFKTSKEMQSSGGAECFILSQFERIKS